MQRKSPIPWKEVIAEDCLLYQIHTLYIYLSRWLIDMTLPCQLFKTLCNITFNTLIGHVKNLPFSKRFYEYKMMLNNTQGHNANAGNVYFKQFRYRHISHESQR